MLLLKSFLNKVLLLGEFWILFLELLWMISLLEPLQVLVYFSLCSLTQSCLGSFTVLFDPLIKDFHLGFADGFSL